MKRIGTALCALMLGAGVAAADSVANAQVAVTDLQQKLSSVRSSTQLTPLQRQSNSRNLDRAKRAFGIGDYESSALLLFDVVAGGKSSTGYDEGLYYLGESLFRQKDYFGARTFFAELDRELGSQSRYHRQALERLLEISVLLGDPSGADDWSQKLSGNVRQSSTSYALGRHAYFVGKYKDAEGYFRNVPRSDSDGLKASYFLGVSLVAQKRYDAALSLFLKIADEKVQAQPDAPAVDHVTWDLAALAAARIYYEKNDFVRAIDTYLRIPRQSQYFDESLYEISWTYIRAQKYKNALQSLELLAASDPAAPLTPETKLLEAGLRVRVAVQDSKDGTGNPKEDYDKALVRYESVRNQFQGELNKLNQSTSGLVVNQELLDVLLDPNAKEGELLSSLASRWIGEEPNVKQVKRIERDLRDVERYLKQGEKTLSRIDAILTSSGKVNSFPEIAAKRAETNVILNRALQLQGTLLNLYSPSNPGGSYAVTQKNRQEKLTLISGQAAFAETRATEQNSVVEQEKLMSELSVQVEAMRADIRATKSIVAGRSSRELPDAHRAYYRDYIASLEKELAAIEMEKVSLLEETRLLKDQAGGQHPLEDAAWVAALRKDIAEEHSLASSLSTRSELDRALNSNKQVVSDALAHRNKIDTYVNSALTTSVTGTLENLRAQLAKDLAEVRYLRNESNLLVGEVVTDSLKNVHKKFIDLVVRAEIGAIDVLWSQKEDVDKNLRSLEINEQRELRTLRDAFIDSAGSSQ